jgi:hypothetical protein
MGAQCNLSIQILMMLKKYFSTLLIGIFLLGCKKEIQLPLDPNQSLLVIDGSITDEAGPYYIKLSKSNSISASSNFLAVTSALVIVKDNLGIIDTLKHEKGGAYKTNKIKGIYGNTYYLEVQVADKKYTASSTMPQKVALDSLRINPLAVNGETRYNVIPVYTDPIALGNSYRFIQKINDTLDQTFHVFNDNLNNGKVNQRPLRGGSDSLEVKLKDMIAVEMQCITRPTYLYYYTLYQQSGAGPGGGTTPSNPPTNIIGGALGIFSAHTVQRRQVQIK